MSYYNFRLISPLFFPLKEIKSVSTVKGEATLTRSVPFSMEHIKKEEEEEEEEKEEVARGVDVVAMATMSL